MALVFILMAVAAMIALNLAPRRPRPPAPPQPLDDFDPVELAAQDPVEALRRYGVPGEAAHLAEQGVDLKGLGYRGEE